MCVDSFLFLLSQSTSAVREFATIAPWAAASVAATSGELASAATAGAAAAAPTLATAAAALAASLSSGPTFVVTDDRSRLADAIVRLNKAHRTSSKASPLDVTEYRNDEIHEWMAWMVAHTTHVVARRSDGLREYVDTSRANVVPARASSSFFSAASSPTEASSSTTSASSVAASIVIGTHTIPSSRIRLMVDSAGADITKMQQRLNQHGYLYISGLLPRADVDKSRRTVIDHLQSKGAIRDDTDIDDGFIQYQSVWDQKNQKKIKQGTN